MSDCDAHLMHFVPFWVEVVADDFALEELVPNLDDAVRVWLAFDQPFHVGVLTQQVLCLNEVEPQDALKTQKEAWKEENSL